MKFKINLFIIILSIVFIFLIYLIYLQYQKISALKNENLVLTEEISQLNINLEKIKDEIQSNINLLEEYKTDIQTSMFWFKDNAIITEELSKKDISLYLRNRCYETSSNDCSINLGCFYLVNEEFLNLEYKLDIETSNQLDNLQSLKEFLTNNGGDCEDYALFYKAEYNYLSNKCEFKSITLRGWESSEDESDEVWLDNGKNWYLNYAKETILPEGYIYPNVVCGNIYDLNTDSISGHCIIAFTKKEINSITDLKELDKSPIIEPQNGEYLGLINDVSSEVYLLEENQEDYPTSFVYEVITDKDLFFFEDETTTWLGYSYFYTLLDEQQQKLINL